MHHYTLAPDYDLNELLAKLDASDRYAVFVLLDLTTALVATHGEPPPDKSTWNDTYCLVYLLHNTMMALLRGEVRPLTAAVAAHLNHCGLRPGGMPKGVGEGITPGLSIGYGSTGAARGNTPFLTNPTSISFPFYSKG